MQNVTNNVTPVRSLKSIACYACGDVGPWDPRIPACAGCIRAASVKFRADRPWIRKAI